MINDFNELTGYKIKIQKLIFFLYTGNNPITKIKTLNIFNSIKNNKALRNDI